VTADNATWTVLWSAGTVHVAEVNRPVLVGLIVDRRRPVEIGIDLINFPGPAWWIGRDLLSHGLAGRSGYMDVIVEPWGPLRVSVLLRASHVGDQDCTVLLLRREVRRALAMSRQIADRAVESEWIERSVDGLIARCVGRGAS
jgi:hypothetical protein